MKRNISIALAALLLTTAGCAEPPPPGDCCMDENLVLQCMDETSLWDGFAPPYGTYAPIDPGKFQPDFHIRIANMIFQVPACPGAWGTPPHPSDVQTWAPSDEDDWGDESGGEESSGGDW